MKRLPELDGLRGCAILLVLWAHFPFVQGLEPVRHIAMSLGTGHFGVNVFFVLSGFLITRILIAEKQQGRFSMARFYLKRALRIFPIYYLTLLLVCVLITARHAGWLAIYMGNFVFAFDTSAHPLRHTWSLAVEEHFYLIWPLILGGASLVNARRIVRYVLPAFAVLCAVLTYAWLPHVRAEHLIYRGTMYQMLPLCLGAAVAFDEERARKLKGWLLLVLMAVVPVAMIAASRAHTVPAEAAMQLSGFTLKLLICSFGSLAALLVALNISERHAHLFSTPWRWALCNPVLRSIGKVSYGLYLYHFPMLFVLGLLDANATITGWQALGVLALIFGSAYLSWYVIEAPILRVKERLTAGPARPE